MMLLKNKIIVQKVTVLLCFLIAACTKFQVGEDAGQAKLTDTIFVSEKKETSSIFTETKEAKLAIIVPRDIQMKHYFAFMDSVAAAYDTLVNYPLTEHILVRANPWIIDTLASFDYYESMKRGIFIYDQREVVVLKESDTLWLPDQQEVSFIEDQLKNTLLEVNIPEYKLRIKENDSVKYTFSVRVGRNERKYLKIAGREVSLQTPIGEGKIVRIERNPWYINPVTAQRYFETKRDDGRRTKLPQIPFLEPMIGGIRQGALIHPTTNANTLGKSYSNGCVGTGEGDAWIIYYHAPVGTLVNFRYDLNIINEQGDSLQLQDIYQLKKVETLYLSTVRVPLFYHDSFDSTPGHHQHNCQ
ncbi:L,D-transpeptidase [Catalinimonas niigatensis]|uniref:L,D-transpeptidase n=1 Tax=Catalinimonas niigatensis TaxID=1397264 RepID=UPI0026665C19|nr:L,D-transpeptidase [Catalinimonas niigatensis]WPP49799.1 L,D-transpeptidase [Catalinimonas niigatensis]